MWLCTYQRFDNTNKCHSSYSVWNLSKNLSRHKTRIPNNSVKTACEMENYCHLSNYLTTGIDIDDSFFRTLILAYVI